MIKEIEIPHYRPLRNPFYVVIVRDPPPLPQVKGTYDCL